MCGIFGVFVENGGDKLKKDIPDILKALFVLSESRGKEAAGACLVSGRQAEIVKKPIPASKFTQDSAYTNSLQSAIETSVSGSGGLTVFGHSRLVTNGSAGSHFNNQPVIADGMVAVHNGIIVNDEEIFSSNPDLSKKYDIDTEVVLRLIRSKLKSHGHLRQAVQEAFALIDGTVSIALLFEDFNKLLLATNNGSLYVCEDELEKIRIFASEEIILEEVKLRPDVVSTFGEMNVKRVEAGEAYLVDLDTFDVEYFKLKEFSQSSPNGNGAHPSKTIEIKDLLSGQSTSEEIEKEDMSLCSFSSSVPSSFEDHVDKVFSSVSQLRRCTKCILPETMPFITFDADGVCSYCKSYEPIELKGEDKLRQDLEKYRNKSGRFDSVISLSGGRDSSFGLHYMVTEMGLRPVTYTYDWGMVTDIARRNIARLCGELGIEHILVSANIKRKRANIRRNVSAWLRNPQLGLIPLFMAGDKQYFYWGNEMMKRFKCKVMVLSENLLEKTHFKSGFCGVSPFSTEGNKNTYGLTFSAKAKMISYYLKNFGTNPYYLNQSLLDTFLAYCSYYVINHDFLSLFQYIDWDEDRINQTLIDNYNWEVAKDTSSTWRIGDGTASFYNYIYFVAAGFTENDTFRSNQIREGKLDREEALSLSQRDNGPRWESIKWYCATVGIDFEETIKIINRMPTLYSRD